MDGHQGRPVRGRGVVGRGRSLRCRSSGDATATRGPRVRRAAVVPSAACLRSTTRVPSPACASSTARRSSPGRTARCSWATSAPTSSRSSRRRATRRAAGVRRGSAATADGTRTAAYYLAVNRNKRSIRLDLQPPGRRRDPPPTCSADADVLVENFRPGGFARLGFDDAALEALNPRLVHLAITGYGTDGPAADAARLRLRDPGGERADVDHRRARCGRREPDQGRRRDQRRRDGDARRRERAGGAAGSGRASGAGRTRRRRVRSGGQRIDISLLGATLASLVNQAQNAFVTGVAPGRLGNAHPNIVPYETFDTADGPIAVAVGLRAPVAAFCAPRSAAGARRRPALRDERRSRRAPRRAAADPRRAVRRARSTADWLAALEAAEIPCGPINDIVAAFASPEAVALGMTVEQEHPGVGRHPPGRASRSGSRATPATIRTPPPTLGQDTDAILAELGLRRRRRSRASARAGWSDRIGPDPAVPGPARLYSSWRRNDQAATPTARRDQHDRRDDRDQDVAGVDRRARRQRDRRRRQPAGQEPAHARHGRHDRQHEQRHEPDPGRRGGRAGDGAGEERDRGPRHEPEPREHRRAATQPRDGRRLEQDRACRSSRPRRPATVPTPRISADRHDLRAEERAARRRSCDSTNAAVPRSVLVATAPIARTIAANAPNWARFFQSWSTASAATGVGSGDRRAGRRPAALMISGRNRASSGEVRPTSRNRPATTGRRSVRHDSSSSLRSRTRRRSRERPPRARRRADEAQEDVLERRPDALEGGQPDAGRDDERQEPGRRRSLRRTTETIEPPVASRSPRRPRARRARRAGQRRDRARPARAPGRAGRAAGRTGRAASSSGPSVTSRPWSRIADPVADPLDVGQDMGREDDRGARRAARR